MVGHHSAGTLVQPDFAAKEHGREHIERAYIIHRLEEFEWNITRTSEMLGIERTNLHKKIKFFGLRRQ